MKLILLSTEITERSEFQPSRIVHIPVVYQWQKEWIRVSEMHHEEGDGRECTWFLFNEESIYMVQTNCGCDGTTFLDGKGNVLGRAEVGRRLGIGTVKVVMIPQEGSI